MQALVYGRSQFLHLQQHLYLANYQSQRSTEFMWNICEETQFHFVYLFYPLFLILFFSQRQSQRPACHLHPPETVNNARNHKKVQQKCPKRSKPRTMYRYIKPYFLAFFISHLSSRFTHFQHIIARSQICIIHAQLVCQNPIFIKTFQFIKVFIFSFQFHVIGTGKINHDIILPGRKVQMFCKWQGLGQHTRTIIRRNLHVIDVKIGEIESGRTAFILLIQILLSECNHSIHSSHINPIIIGHQNTTTLGHCRNAALKPQFNRIYRIIKGRINRKTLIAGYQNIIHMCFCQIIAKIAQKMAILFCIMFPVPRFMTIGIYTISQGSNINRPVSRFHYLGYPGTGSSASLQLDAFQLIPIPCFHPVKFEIGRQPDVSSRIHLKRQEKAFFTK